MQKTIDHPTGKSEAADRLAGAALRAEAWAGEPFLHPDEDPAEVLAPGTSRRIALDEALEEMEAGRSEPSSEWKVRFGLMLGLERVLSEKPPHLRSGTELRRHQIDALAGMLTELIAAAQRDPEPAGEEAEDDFDYDEDEENGEHENAEHEENGNGDLELEPDDELPPTSDPGAVRRYRFRHPTASGKTIAAA